MNESPKRPPAWRYITFFEADGKFFLCCPVSYGPIGPSAIKAAKLPAKTATVKLTLKQALETGQKLEDWRAGQEESREKGRKTRSK